MMTEDQGTWLCIAILCIGNLILILLTPTDYDDND